MSDTTRQLVFTKERELHWREITTPTLSDRESALVRPIAVARSDLDAYTLCQPDASSINLKNLKQEAIVGLAKRIHLDRYTAAMPVGQQCIAEVIETGPDVSGLPRGQRVVVTASLSCGACVACLAGKSAHCTTFDNQQAFGTLDKPSALGGLLTDLIRIPHASRALVPLPDTLDPVMLSSAGSDLADAWCSVMPRLQERSDAKVLVLGGAARTTALYVLALAGSRNVAVLDYLDQTAERLAIARALGANADDTPLRRHQGSYDIIVSGNTESGVIKQMLKLLQPGGVYVQLLPQLLKEEKIPLDRLYQNNLTLVAARSHLLTSLRPMLEFLSSNPLDLGVINTHIGNFDEAPEHFAKNTSKVVVQRAQLH